AVPLLVDILSVAPGVQMLVTSREALNIQAERLLLVQGLPYPASVVATNEALTYAAVRLFVESARYTQPGFTLTPKNLAAVVRVCQLVQGMPLALEIAARWMRTFSCDEIAERIARSLEFMVTPLRDVP